ncbi:BTB/POZ domain and ankyrin repeat-containing protein NPR5-like [Phoenix dactylifera]|uniref:BTB/POZ domain and ankyrin repeat-containing protein NPR5-like n=1 Tax=Phoenix dactylifera TaxID=42345 RepID=A0A8B7CG78_PHODC|nr:BTB/POZ domain and ankyrin repeat-containing protein NPR5-like [Phoenix dactylifera]
MEDSLKSLSMDYLNLLINGQAFSDVTFSVEGRLVHAHRCILAARSLFFRKFFCGPDPPSPGLLLLHHQDLHSHHHHHQSPRSPSGASASSPRGGASPGSAAAGGAGPVVIPVNSVGYEVFLLLLQFLYSGQVSLVPQKHEPRPNCGERGCWHTHCTAAVDLALDTLAAARSFGVEQLALLTQKQLASMVEKASIEDVMKVLMASRKQDMHQLWTTCSHLVAKSGLPAEVLAKHLPIDVVAKIEELRLKSSLARRSSFMAHHHPLDIAAAGAGPSSSAAAELEDHHHKIRRMRRALDSSDVELVKLMVMGEGLNLDDALALHYAVENCSREVVKALLELGAADVNCPARPAGKTPLHIAAEMVCPDMVAVLLDHHADPNIRTVDGVTPLDILRTLTSDFLFKGAVPGLSHIEPNKLRLCLELVQSAALVMSREEAANCGSGGGSHPTTDIYPPMNPEPSNCNASSASNSMVNLSLDSRMVYLNLGIAAQLGCKIDDGGEDDSSSSRSQGGGGGIGPSSMYSSHGFP